MTDKTLADAPAGETAGAGVLSQGEIDALFGAVSSPEQERAIDVLIQRTRDGAMQDLPLLEIIADRVARALETKLRNFFGENVSAMFESQQSVRLREFVNQIEMPSMIMIIRNEDWGGQSLLIISSRLVYLAVDTLLGGKRSNNELSTDGRQFTSVERRLMTRFASHFLEVVQDCWEEAVGPSRFRVDRIETIPRFALIGQPTQPCAVSKFRLDIGDRSGLITLCHPLSTMHRFRKTLSQISFREEAAAPEDAEAVRRHTLEVPLQAEAVLMEAELDLETIMSWRPGTVVDVPRGLNAVVDLIVAGRKVMHGKLGRKRGRLAVELEDFYMEVDPVRSNLGL
jgi:flagellar motor switch protein FliM